MQSLFFLPVILMLFVYLGLIFFTFYFVYYLVNKSLVLKREQNELLRQIISKLDKQQKYDAMHEFLSEESSEHKRTMEALKESEYKYKIAFQSCRDSINIIERDGTYIDVNEGFTNITGYTKEDVLGKLSSEINIWAIPEDLLRLSAGLKEKGYVENLESIFRCKDGSFKTAIISANIIILYNEPHIQVIAHDVTERKRMEELILQSKQQYDNLVSNIPVGVYILRSKPVGTYTLDYVSPKMAKMLHFSTEYLMSSGDAILEAIHPDDLEGFVKMNQEGIKEKRPFDWKGRAIIKGAIKWLHISSQPQELECGDILWNGLVIDITEQVLAKAEIEHQKEELQKLNATKDKFISIIAHDLRSPINSILGFCNVLMEQINNKDIENIDLYAQIIVDSSNKAMELLKNLMEWSRGQIGRMEFSPEYLDLTALILETTHFVDSIAGQKSISIKSSLPPHLNVFADKAMISTVLRNIISNAIKFTPTGGEVNIMAYKDPDEIIISVSDTGVGISPESINKLFRIDHFYSTTGTNKERGTGLGLILCKEFVEKHKGKIWVDSKIDEGSTFYFTLPNNVLPVE